MGLSPTVPTVRKDDWDSVIQFNRFMQKYFGKLTSTQLGGGSTPSFSGITLSGLTASRLISSDASKSLSSVTDLTSWIAGTANRVTVADDGDGTTTLSGPQDIHVDAEPEFAGYTIKDGSDNVVCLLDVDEFYVTKAVATDGTPIGLLLVLTREP